MERPTGKIWSPPPRGGSSLRILRDWVEFQCNQLTACFLAQKRIAPGVQLGTMVMYLGSEKAGIRLTDYRDVPFRVGEFMFNDRSFAPVKGKTDELFSCLFHRRFARPELAYSETTAFPADQLSARNMAAKLTVSTLSDVRNTMFMSGLTPFPRQHWQTLAPAMKQHAELHRKIAGHRPHGPFKHYWGEASRYVGDDNPFSLFLALGVPFEVTGELARDGMTFLSDADARTIGTSPTPGTALLARPQANLSRSIRPIPESLSELFAWKREILPRLKAVPYVEGEVPVVCAWFPTARAVLVWNLNERREEIVLRLGTSRRVAAVEGLGVVLMEGISGEAVGADLTGPATAKPDENSMVRSQSQAPGRQHKQRRLAKEYGLEELRHYLDRSRRSIDERRGWEFAARIRS